MLVQDFKTGTTIVMDGNVYKVICSFGYVRLCMYVYIFTHVSACD